MRSFALLCIGLFVLILFANCSSARAADQPVCHGQPEMSERELRRGIKAMRDIIDRHGTLTPEEEENLIRSRGLDSGRLNCLMGKLMAANDIFGWGGAGEYGVPLTSKEKKLSAGYKKESLALKRYMEEVLNVRLE